MINELVRDCDVDLAAEPAPVQEVLAGGRRALARTLTCLQAGKLPEGDRARLAEAAAARRVPVLGITGTGGSGKSSLTDELVRRLRVDQGTGCASRCWRSTRPGGAAAARCSATGSG